MFNVEDCKIIELPKIVSNTGNITVAENNSEIPFEIKRVYYLYDLPVGAERGGHGHKALEQIVVAASGSFTFYLDDGRNKKEVFLNNPSQALHIKPGIWREIKGFSSGSICLVLASELYDEKDYFRNYELYKKWKLMR